MCVGCCRKATVSAEGDVRQTVAPLSASDDIHMAEVLHVSSDFGLNIFRMAAPPLLAIAATGSIHAQTLS